MTFRYQSHRPLRSARTAHAHTRRAAIVAAVALLAYGSLRAQPESLPGLPQAHRSRSAVSLLTRDISAIIGDSAFADATWGISVVSCDNGETLVRYNDRRNRVAASNIKLLTTAAALDRLGGGFRFSTDLYISGTIQPNGELLGDVVVRAAGDPSISPTFGVDPRALIRSWAEALGALGINAVQNVLVDASYFDAVPYGPGWSWDDEPYSYNAPISAAAIYDNCVEITVRPGAEPGEPVSIDVEPPTAYVTLKVTAVTSRSDSTSTLDIRRERGSEVITVGGNIAAGSAPYAQQVTIERPALFFATLMQEEFERSGVSVRGAPFDAAEAPAAFSYALMRKVATHTSPELRQIVAATNKLSLNLSAEMLAKRLGREVSSAGSTAAGVDAVKRLLVRAGIDVERLRLYDGSGLSRMNMIAPADIVALLRWCLRAPIATDFVASLAVAGRDGTLAGRMRGTLAENNVTAKTGFLGGIRAISGYVRSRDGELLAFSIIVNNYSVPTSVVNTAQDLICMRLASFSRKS